MIIFDVTTGNIFFDEEVVRSLYDKDYKSKLIFMDPSTMSKDLIQAILRVSTKDVARLIRTSKVKTNRLRYRAFKRQIINIRKNYE